VRVGVAGVGAVGSRAIRRLLAVDVEVVLARDNHDGHHRPASADATDGFAKMVSRVDQPWEECALDALIVASPPDEHVTLVRRMLGQVPLIVTTTDALNPVRELLALDAPARAADTAVIVGAAFGPGLSCLIAARAAARMDQVDEIRFARFGTGGPACARQHHDALGSTATAWHDGVWIEHAGGSGRELCWFPDPVGAADCYHAALAEPILMVDALPQLARVSARLAATRRDRLTARFPMLRPPHPEGALGAIRVEVRGADGAGRSTKVYGVAERPAVAAAAMAAAVALHLGPHYDQPSGCYGVAQVADAALLDEVTKAGVVIHRFAGTEGATGW
jgi:hypothetical protein